VTEIAAGTAALAALALLAVAVAALRRPLLARIAYRQVVRRPGQSVLMVCGMALASGAILAMGALADTSQRSYDDEVRLGWGTVDLAVTGGGALFSSALAGRLAASPEARAQRAGVSPGLDLVGAAADLDRGRAAGSLQLVGVDGPTIAPFGPFHLTDGRVLQAAALHPGQAVLSERAPGLLGARLGDRVRVVLGLAGGERAQLEVTLAGVARSEQVGAYGQVPGLFLPLADLQRAARTDHVNIVRIGLPEAGTAGEAAAHRAAPALRRALAAIPGTGGLELREVQQDDRRWNDDAYAGPTFKSSLLALSLLVVLAGVAVVVNLLLAMAEERRPRLAVLRALGLSRADLVRASLIEAAFYGVAGAALGLLPGLAYVAYETQVKQSPPSDFWGVPSVAPAIAVEASSAVFAVSAGLLVSLVTVLAASLRTSRMAISSAVKDLPEPLVPSRTSPLRWVWVAVLAAVGVAGLAATAPILRDLGGALLLLAATAAARGRVPDRVRASLAGASLGAWSFGFLVLAPNDGNTAFAAMVVAVVLGVSGVALLVSANLAMLERLVAGASSRLSAALRPPLAYLTRRPVRTGLATGTFGVVLAGLAVFNVLLSSELPTYATAGSGWDVVAKSAGDPAVTLPASLRGRVADQTTIRTLSYVGDTRDVYRDWHQAFTIFLALTDQQLQHPPIRLAQRDARYPSDAAVWRAMREDPTLAVTFAANSQNGPISVGSRRQPVTFRLAAGAQVPIFGWTTSWLVVSERALARLPAHGLGSILLLKATPGTAPPALAADVRRQLESQGVDATTTRQALETDVANDTFWVTTFFSDIFELGLAVGVLSLGVLALRAVVERRPAIGVLRALGYQQPSVFAALLMEALILVAIGVAAGMAVGLLVAYAWVSGPSMAGQTPRFAVDVPRLLAPVGLVFGAVVLVTPLPAIRASRLPVAEALRIVG
jgi:putative ABC transport system permease protein